jgi:hypothetical protein
MGGFIALGFLKDASKENRALFFIVSSLGMIGCLSILMILGVFWRRLRRWTWQRAMASWGRSSRTNTAPKSVLPANLQEADLRKLALQIFSRIGYRVVDGKESGAYLYLINPDQRLELVAFKQQPDSIVLPHVYSLELEMKRTKAVRGFFWAPGGFTDECKEWVVNRPIVLADCQEIGRLMDCSQAKGSRLLDP